MTSNITTTRQMRGADLTIEDFLNLFAHAPISSAVRVRIEDGDRFGSPTASITVEIAPTVSGAAGSEAFGDREATR